MRLHEIIVERFSPAFHAWFGNSQVVDADGRPLKVYHGTPTAGFDTFSDEHKGLRSKHAPEDVAYHFTTDPEFADAFSGSYLIRSHNLYTQMVGREPNLDLPRAPAIYPVYLSIQNPLRLRYSKEINAHTIERAVETGHDGIIADHGTGTEYVVFRPSQIKSTVANRGSYDLASEKITEDEVADLTAAYKRLKAKRDQMNKDVADLPYPSLRDDPLAPASMRLVQVQGEHEWERKHDYYKRMRSLFHHRLIDINHDLDVLRAQLWAAKQRGTPNEIFAAYDTQKTKYQREYLDELGKMIDAADADLPDPASRAVTSFVGHAYSRNPEAGAPGIMIEEPLEDAYSAHPSERGLKIRHQLETAFAPIRDALRHRFGDTVTIHRAQGPLKGDEKSRHVLSWTSNLRFAETLARGGTRDIHTKAIPVDDIVWITDRANQSEFIIRSK